ncbi:hypothetical protein TWF481_000141 [Arthrobotrys musiformis]|uniref:Uncharacterized protein n=1 Tax=Arthrobotrys musiformis TaxID=47236 RepID=A0AAV9WNW5_9PEZI
MMYTLAFLATLEVVSAWSYNVLRGGNAPTAVADFHGVKVLASRQPCTPLDSWREEFDTATGLQIYQFARQPLDRQWARPVGYVGFWGGEECGGMPRYIVHWYDLVDTEQSILFDTIMEGSLGWGEQIRPVLGVKSWGELVNGDQLWPGQIPQGGAAVLVQDLGGLGGLEDAYLVLENVVSMGELISASRRTMPRDDVNWEDYGGGTTNQPRIVDLGVEAPPSQGNGQVSQDTQEAVEEPSGQSQNQAPDTNSNDDGDDDFQFIDRNQFRENTIGRNGPVLPPIENQVQRNNPTYREGIQRVEEPTTGPRRSRRIRKKPGMTENELERELKKQQDEYRNLQRKAQSPLQSKLQSKLQNKAQEQARQTPTPNLAEANEQKMLELLKYWVGLGLSQEFLVEQIRKLPDTVYVSLFKLAIDGRIGVEQIAQYLIDYYKSEVQEMEMLNLKAAQIEAANERELRGRLASAQIQASDVANRMGIMRQMVQNQGLVQSATNWFTGNFGNPYPSNGMNNYMNANVNSNMNIGGPNPALSNPGGRQQPYGWNYQQIYGNPGGQQQAYYGNTGQVYGNPSQIYGNQGQMYANQGQMYGNPTYGNQGQIYGNQAYGNQAYGNQGQMYGNQYQGGRQASYQPYQTQQTQQDPKVEQEKDEQSPDTNDPRGNHMPSERQAGFLDAPPGTPRNPTLADYSDRSNDYLDYLKRENLMAQLPGFAEAGQIGGMQGITNDELNELAQLLRMPGGGRHPTSNAPSNYQPNVPTGGSTLAQMLAGMNAGRGEQQNGGMMEEEEGEEDYSQEEDVKEEWEEF